MVRFCSNCRKLHPITTKKCPICGLSDLPRFCTKCKKFVPDGVKYCPTCGDIDTTIKITNQKTTQIPIHSSNKKGTITMFIVSTITIFSIIIFGFVIPYFDPCKDGHIWKDGTCTDPRICTVCGKTDGNKLGHNWEGGTCTIQKYALVVEK